MNLSSDLADNNISYSYNDEFGNSAQVNGNNLTELKIKYAEQLAKRKEYRTSIDILQIELDALNEEIKKTKSKNNKTINSKKAYGAFSSYKKIKIKWISILSYSLILVQNEVN